MTFALRLGPCRCGSARDDAGRCLHCDYPPPTHTETDPAGNTVLVSACPSGCVPCLTRDSHCFVCGGYCQTVTAAHYHERQCRARENLTA